MKTDVDIFAHLFHICLNERRRVLPSALRSVFEATHSVASGTPYNDEKGQAEKVLSQWWCGNSVDLMEPL